MSDTALVRSDPRGLMQQMAAWTRLSDEALKRRAATAAANRDADELWSLARAFLVLKGRSRGHVSPNTLRSYETGVRVLVDAWSGENLLRPTRNAGDAFVADLSMHLSASTVGVRLCAARVLYQALRWSDATNADPFVAVRAPIDPTPPWEKRQPYSPEEVKRLLTAADPVEAALVLLGAHAGLRASEMLALRWVDVHFGRGELVVDCGKGGKRRTVQMSPTLAGALSGLPRQAPTVVTFRSYSRLAKRMYALCDRAGVPRRGLHSLRHASGTAMLKATGSLLDVAQHLGHSSVEMSRVYAKWSPAKVRAAVARW